VVAVVELLNKILSIKLSVHSNIGGLFPSISLHMITTTIH